MPYSSHICELVYILEIKKTVRWLRKKTRKRREELSSTLGLNLAIKLPNSSSDYFNNQR